MGYKVIWTKEALADIEAIAEYIEKDSFFYASSVVSKILDVAKFISTFPFSGRAVLEKNNEVVQQVQTVIQPVQQPQPTPEPVVEVKKENNLTLTLNAPMVGTFYVAPSPTAKPFVNVGDIVRKGQTVAIIEAMKIMNEWEAEFDCRILKVLVDDGQPVEYGTPIFEVEKING